jgi:hypothetical protein
MGSFVNLQTSEVEEVEMRKPRPQGSLKVEKVERAPEKGSADQHDRRMNWLAGGGYGSMIFIMSCDHVDCPHNFLRRRLMHHVPSSRNTSQRAVRNFPVQMSRLAAFNDAIFRSCKKQSELPKKPAPSRPPAENVISLMDVLKRSLAAERLPTRSSTRKAPVGRIGGAPPKRTRARQAG